MAMTEIISFDPTRGWMGQTNHGVTSERCIFHSALDYAEKIRKINFYVEVMKSLRSRPSKLKALRMR